VPPRFEGLPTASSQAVPLDGCFALILSLGGRGKTAAGALGARTPISYSKDEKSRLSKASFAES
jgi:hypothetical protein